MENVSGKEVKKAAKRKLNKEVRVSSSGRNITTPKHLQTTSSDDQPPRKRNRSSKNLKAEIERLKRVAALMQKGNLRERETEHRKNENKRDTTEQPAETSQNTADVRTLNTSNDSSNDSIELSLPGTSHSIEVKTKTKSSGVTEGIKSTPPSQKAAAVLENVFPITPVTEVQHHRIGNVCDEFSDENVPMNFHKKVNDRLQNLEKMSKTLIEQNEAILKILNNQLNVGGGKLSETLYEPLKDFPLTTVAQFKELYDHLLCLGGSALRNFLSCALGVIMTDKLVCEFSWNGDSHTEKLGDTKVSNVMYQAAKRCTLFQGPENKNVFKNDMLQVLKTTKQQFRNTQKRSLGRNDEKETAEHIEDKISELQRVLAGASDADDEEYSSDNLDDEDFN